jgi:alpha-tubulin suppressor-like RCC1 family protein
VTITTGYFHSCAITAAHQLYCWGSNDAGQLGDGTTTGRNVAGIVAGSLAFARVAAGAGHTCALTVNGEAYCWGLNLWGEVGDGSRAMRLSPVRVAPDLHFVDVFAGGETTCALTSNGNVYCWGIMVGTSASAPYFLPAQVSADVQFKSLNLSEYAVCGLALDDTPYCLRATATSDGVSGGPGIVWRPQPGPSGFTSFAGGVLSDCGLDASLLATCFGNNDYGQLGDGDTNPRDGLAPVSGHLAYLALYSGYDWTCGTTAAAQTFCWGHNNWGALGDNTNQHYVEVAPKLLTVPTGLSFTAMDGGYYHMCGIGTDTLAYCWGAGMNGQLGDGRPLEEFYARPLPEPVRIR